MSEDSNGEDDESDTQPGFHIIDGADVYIGNSDFGDQDMKIEGDTDTTIVDSKTSGSVEMAGNSAYIDGLELLGGGNDAAFELLNTDATISNLRIAPGYRYGLLAQDSRFTMDESVIQGDKYDLRFRSGVLADMYNVQADEILDLARGKKHIIQQGIIKEAISTKDEHIQAEEIAKKIGRIISIISFVFLSEDIYNVFE